MLKKKKGIDGKNSGCKTKEINRAQKKYSSSKFINNPSDFVGFSIQHRVREKDSLNVSWERAQVVQIDQLNVK